MKIVELKNMNTFIVITKCKETVRSRKFTVRINEIHSDGNTSTQKIDIDPIVLSFVVNAIEKYEEEE
jgi:hypothetical protein